MDIATVIQERLQGRLRLRTLPRVAQRVKDALESGNSNLGDIGNLIALDPPLSARLLRSVNSALYGLSSDVFETAHAASILGVKGLRNLTLRAPVMESELFTDLKGVGFDAVDMWRESIAISRIAPLLARAASTPVEPERLISCGLLANLGRFALCDALAEEYAEACLRSFNQGIPLVEVEKEAFGFSHAELGAMLASRWSLPDDVIKATRFHHNEKGLAEVDPLCALLMATGTIVECLIREVDQAECLPKTIELLPERTTKLLGLDGLSEVRLEGLADGLAEAWEGVKV